MVFLVSIGVVLDIKEKNIWGKQIFFYKGVSYLKHARRINFVLHMSLPLSNIHWIKIIPFVLSILHEHDLCILWLTNTPIGIFLRGLMSAYNFMEYFVPSLRAVFTL
jgi:hypothetical protein